VDGAIEVDGEKFFEGATVTNVIRANTIALLIEVDEPINVTQDQLDDMAASGGTASGLSTLLGDYSEVTLPENGDVDLDNNIVVGE
jgi:histidine ammonia-lyase